MDINVFNKDLELVGVVDTVDSFLWIDRLNSYGEFELYTNVTVELLYLLQKDFYLKISQSDKSMIVESISVMTDAENGDKLIIRGRSLESILDRRIVLQQTIFDASSFQDGIEQILNENIISSSQPNRNVSNFVFSASVNATITALLLTAQYDGENIYDVVEYLSKKEEIGFRILLNEVNQFVFSLYVGEDRSYEQTDNPFVVFSPSFDNLISSDYRESNQYRKTYTLVFGETHGWRVEAFISGGTLLTGLDRREIFTDASDLSTALDGGGTIDPADYHLQLKERGYKTLTENRFYSMFEGEADTTVSYKYGKDFFLGDIVQIEDKYGNLGRSKITEVMISEDPSGFRIVPTFEPL